VLWPDEESPVPETRVPVAPPVDCGAGVTRDTVRAAPPAGVWAVTRRTLVTGSTVLGVVTVGVDTLVSCRSLLTLGLLTVGTVVCGVLTAGVLTDGVLTLGTVTVGDGTVPVSPVVPTDGTFSAGAVAAAMSSTAKDTIIETAAIHFPRSIARTSYLGRRTFKHLHRGIGQAPVEPLQARTRSSVER
jgi:hypothetical protein